MKIRNIKKWLMCATIGAVSIGMLNAKPVEAGTSYNFSIMYTIACLKNILSCSF